MIKCDFCGKTQNEVPRIIEGKNGVAICGKCVLTCMSILLQETQLGYKEIGFKEETKTE